VRLRRRRVRPLPLLHPRYLQRYRARLSGPLADRIDLHVRVGAVALAELGEPAAARSRARPFAARVLAARDRQRERYRVLPGVTCNAEAPGRWLQAACRQLDARHSRELLGRRRRERLRLSARAYHRTLRVARTVADLDGAAIA
jgi:magnesium chelatase family protein